MNIIRLGADEVCVCVCFVCVSVFVHRRESDFDDEIKRMER